MDEFSKSISSLSWWLGVVVVGILLNIISAYLKSPLDRLFSGVSGWWRTRSDVERSKRAAAIAKLSGNFEEQIVLAHTETRHRLRGTLFALVTVFMLVLYLSVKLSLVGATIKGGETHDFLWVQKLFYWGSMLIASFSVVEITRANSCESLLKEVRGEVSDDEGL